MRPRLNGHNLSDASASDVSETCGANREGGEERRSEKERGRREDGERIWRGACLTLLLLPLPPCFVERGPCLTLLPLPLLACFCGSEINYYKWFPWAVLILNPARERCVVEV